MFYIPEVIRDDSHLKCSPALAKAALGMPRSRIVEDFKVKIGGAQESQMLG